jgi:hypothetical protein
MDTIATLEEQLAAPIRDTDQTAQTSAQTSAQTDLATRHKNGVSRLLAHRDDLRGVYAFADVVEESVRWSA